MYSFLDEKKEEKQKSLRRSKILPKMKNIQAMTQAWRALRPSALGELVVMALKMFTRTRNRVMRRAMRPCNYQHKYK